MTTASLHTGIEPGSETGASFLQKRLYSAIKAHKDLREQKAERECKQCNKTYATFWELCRHVARVHQTEKKANAWKQDVHVCKLCFETFGIPETLRRHLAKVHND